MKRSNFPLLAICALSPLVLTGCFSGEESVTENARNVSKDYVAVLPFKDRAVVALDFDQAKGRVFAQSQAIARARNTLRVTREAHERQLMGKVPVVAFSEGVGRLVKNLKQGEDPQAAIGLAFSNLNLVADNVQWYADSVAMEAAEINYQFTCRQQVVRLHDIFRRAQQLQERRFWRRYLGPAAFISSAVGDPKSILHAANNSYLSDFDLESTELQISQELSDLLSDYASRFVLDGRSRPQVPEAQVGLGDLKARLLGAQLESIWLSKFSAYVPLVPEVSLAIATPTLWASQRTGESRSWGDSVVSANASVSYGVMQLYSIGDARHNAELAKREVFLFAEAEAQRRQGLILSMDSVKREQASLRYDLEELRNRAKTATSPNLLLEIQSVLSRQHDLGTRLDQLKYEFWLDNDAAWETFT